MDWDGTPALEWDSCIGMGLLHWDGTPATPHHNLSLSTSLSRSSRSILASGGATDRVTQNAAPPAVPFVVCCFCFRRTSLFIFVRTIPRTKPCWRAEAPVNAIRIWRDPKPQSIGLLHTLSTASTILDINMPRKKGLNQQPALSPPVQLDTPFPGI